MKILEVLAGAQEGGAETAFVDTCLALREAGQDIVVATRANDLRVGRLRTAGIAVHTLPFGGRLDIYTPFMLKQLIIKEKPDIVQTWMSRAAQKTPAWHPRMGIPRYLVVARLGGYYKIRNFKSAQYFTTITPDLRRYVIDKGIEEHRIQVVHNFAETERNFTPLSRADFGIKPLEKIGICLGRLHTSKALDIAIRSVVDISDFHLLIAGEGPERPALEDLIKTLGLEGRVHLLGWRSDRAALLDLADLCLFPSRYEPFGTVFVQAWAAGAPLITTDSHGPRQFVRDGEDGLLVPVDDVAAMTTAIRRVLFDPVLAQKMAENGRLRYEEGFTQQRTIAAYLRFFEDCRRREGLLKTNTGTNSPNA